MGEGVLRMLVEPLRGGVQVLVDPEGGRVLDRGIVELDAGPEIGEDRGTDDLAEVVGLRAGRALPSSGSRS
jgi:hypothetical protein